MKGRTAEIPPISWALLAFFRRIARGYFRRGFHGVRVSQPERLRGASGPLIVYGNHSSWWDPLSAFLLAWKLMPRRKHYAPMDAESLERYRMFKHLGVFPVALKTVRGGVHFLRVGEAVLRAGGVLWVTPQGKFADVRSGLEFRPGLAALAARMRQCTVLPLAIEYIFWDERLPEALLHFGEPIEVNGESAAELEERLVAALAQAMGDLKEMALKREPQAFSTTLLRGRVGTGGFYGLGQRARAALRGQRYRAEHTLHTEGPKAAGESGG